LLNSASVKEFTGEFNVVSNPVIPGRQGDTDMRRGPMAARGRLAKGLILKNESPAKRMHSPDAIMGRGRRPAMFLVKLICKIWVLPEKMRRTHRGHP